MQHLYFDLKQQKKGAVAVVTLDKQANVRLMTASNYRALKAGRRFSFHGGRATKSPVRLAIPNSGHWFVVVDLGGLAGRVRASVALEPPPPGMLPPIRERSPISDVQVREPVEPDGGALGGQTWGVFISHASEDKETVAIPLHRCTRGPAFNTGRLAARSTGRAGPCRPGAPTACARVPSLRRRCPTPGHPCPRSSRRCMSWRRAELSEVLHTLRAGLTATAVSTTREGGHPHGQIGVLQLPL